MRARYPVLLVSAALFAWCAPGDRISAAAGVGDASATSGDARSLLGSYLAGRVARGQNDTEAAAGYYRQALGLDPGNDVLVEQSFLMELVEGNWPRAEELARELVKAQPTHRTAQAFMGLIEFKAQRYAAAEGHFKAANANPIGELTSTLALAWLYQAQGKTQEALAFLDSPKQPDWAQYYLRYHRALLSDQAGRTSEARAAYERIPKNDQRTLRITLAYARSAGHVGDQKLALSLLKAHFERTKNDGHPSARALQEQIEAGERTSLLISTPNEGMAEAFYGLGEALTGEGGVGPGAVYLQFSLYLEPKSAFALAALASAYETTKRYESAIAAYDRIPKGTPLESSIEIRKALNLNQLERIDEAQKVAGRHHPAVSQRHPSARRAGQHHARAQALCGGRRLLHARHRPDRQARAEALVLLLLARHLLRAAEEMAAGGGRSAARARARRRAGRGAQLSRLLLDRPEQATSSRGCP